MLDPSWIHFDQTVTYSNSQISHPVQDNLWLIALYIKHIDRKTKVVLKDTQSSSLLHNLGQIMCFYGKPCEWNVVQLNVQSNLLVEISTK